MLLDLGCGRGGVVEQLEHPLARMVGVDPDFASLQEHRLELPRAAAHSRALPFADESFDVVCASWLLEHLREPLAAFQEIARVLCVGGRFIFITPNRRHPLSLFNYLLGRAGRLQGWLVSRLYGRAAGDTFPTLYRANSRADLERLAAAAGLRLTSLSTIADPTYMAFTPSLFHVAQRVESALSPARQVHLVGCAQKPR